MTQFQSIINFNDDKDDDAAAAAASDTFFSRVRVCALHKTFVIIGN